MGPLLWPHPGASLSPQELLPGPGIPSTSPSPTWSSTSPAQPRPHEGRRARGHRVPGTDGTLHALTLEVCALPSSPRRRIKKPVSLPSVRPASPAEAQFPFWSTWETWRCLGPSVDRRKRRRGQEREDRGAASGLSLPWAASSRLGWGSCPPHVLGPQIPPLDTAPHHPARDPSCCRCRAPVPDRERGHSGDIHALGAEERSLSSQDGG